MADAQLVPRSAFAALMVAVGNGRGVTVCDRDGLGLATVAARNGLRGSLAAALRERLALELPAGATRLTAGAYAIAGMAPGIWLASQEHGANELAATLREALGNAASVADQSDGYGVLRVQGPKVRQALEKLVPLDLHDRAFPPNAVASTLASHMGITLWRLEDAQGSAVFEIAVFRSLAVSFWHALAEGAAEFGVAVGRAV